MKRAVSIVIPVYNSAKYLSMCLDIVFLVYGSSGLTQLPKDLL